MELKVAEYSDYERIATLHAQSWKQYYQGILGQDFLDKEALLRMYHLIVALFNFAIDVNVLDVETS